MSASTDKQLQATLQMNITKNTEAGYSDVFNSFASSKYIYPQFDLYFNDGSQTKPIPKGTILNVTYEYGDASVPAPPRNLNASSMVRLSGFPEGIPASAITDDGLVIRATVTLTYDEEGIQNQFPVRFEDNAGVRVNGYSHLSYHPEIQSGAPTHAVGDKPYYRQSHDVATLLYTTAVPDGGQNSVSQLGINPLDASTSDPFHISTVAYYSAAGLSAAANASYVKCELKYYSKVDGSSAYKEAPEQSIRNSASFTINNSPDSNGIIPVNSIGPSFDPNVPITIGIPLTVPTGNDPNVSVYYSNYKVKLTVSLLDDALNTIEGSTATDYIIYTNAKILTTLVQE